MRLSAADLSKIDPFKRHQHYLMLQDIFPKRIDKQCACGCGEDLPPRRLRWASKECEAAALQLFWIRKGDPQTIRGLLFQKDQGACRSCGEITLNWEADHIIEVHEGGGGCDIDNFQTLCKSCHKEKTILRFNKVAA